MPVTIELTPDLESRLRREAARLGLPPEAYVARALEQYLRDSELNSHNATRSGAGGPAGVYKHPRVSGGDACVGDTRIPVWSLVRFRQLGRSDQHLLADFPSLTAGDLSAAWAYAEQHPDEIERAIREQERA